MLLAKPEKYRDEFNAIKKDIAYMPIELKKNLRKKVLFIYEISFLGKLERLNSTNEYTYMYIDERQSGNWEIYSRKHLLQKKLNIFSTFFKKIIIFNKILKKQKIIFLDSIKYNYFFISKEIFELIKIIYYSIVKTIK